MHIPDGPLSPEVCVAAGAVSLAAVGFSLHKLRDSLADRAVPMTGMMAALIFAGQMVNFPIGLLGVPSVSGHLMGGVLAAVILGPWAGCLAITLVLLVQCLLFADGGLLALGANVLNMAVVGSIGGYAVYAVVRRRFANDRVGVLVGSIVAAWISVVAASALFSVELWASQLSASYNYANVFALMVSVHSAIGVGEALITGGVISFVLQQRPDLIYSAAPAGMAAGAGRAIVAGLTCALAIAAFLAPFASAHPDGLEAVAERVGFDDENEDATVLVFGDYEVPALASGWEGAALWQKVSVSLAGILGTLSVMLTALLMGRALRPRKLVAGASHAE